VADLKISQLTNGNRLDPGDLLVAVRGGNNVKVTADMPTGGTATLLVAASNAPARVKAQADYICDGTDDQITVQTAYDILAASGGGDVILSVGLFNFSSIFFAYSNGTGIIGSGDGSSQWSGTRSGKGTEIQWTGSNGGGPVIDVGPTSGSSGIYGLRLKRFAVYCSSQGSTPTAAIGIRTRSVWQSDYKTVSVKEASTACWQFTTFVSGFTGGNITNHNCNFFSLRAYSYNFNGIPFQFKSEATDNTGGTTLCQFFGTFGYAKDATAVYDFSSVDDLFFFGTNCGIGGTASSVEFRGQDRPNGYKSAANNVHFFSLFPGGPINARAGDGTQPSFNNVIHGLSMADGMTAINIETGANLDYYVGRSPTSHEWNRLKIRPPVDGPLVFKIENAAGAEKLQFNTTQASLGLGGDPATFLASTERGIVVYRNDGDTPKFSLRNQANSGNSVYYMEGRTAGGVAITGDWNMNGATAAAYFRTFTAHPINFWTNNAERMRIASGDGLDFSQGTHTTFDIKLKNNEWITGGTASGNTTTNMLKLNASDALEFNSAITPILATGTGKTVDNVISHLQGLGLARQS
jgi:hypothetical protein